MALRPCMDPIGCYGLIDILNAANEMGNQNAPEIEVHSTGPTIPDSTVTGATNLLAPTSARCESAAHPYAPS